MGELTGKEATEIAKETFVFMSKRICDDEGNVDIRETAAIWAGMAFEIVNQMIRMNGIERKEEYQSYMRSLFEKAMGDV